MPKLMTEESKIKYAAKIRERASYCAYHAAKVVPGPTQDPITKKVLWDKSTESASRNGLKDHPYFKGDKKRYRAYQESNWGSEGGVRHLMAEEHGVCLEYGHGLHGIRRAGKRGAERTATWNQNRMSYEASIYNIEAGCARALLEAHAVSIQLRLLLD